MIATSPSSNNSSSTLVAAAAATTTTSVAVGSVCEKSLEGKNGNSPPRILPAERKASQSTSSKLHGFSGVHHGHAIKIGSIISDAAKELVEK